MINTYVLKRFIVLIFVLLGQLVFVASVLSEQNINLDHAATSELILIAGATGGTGRYITNQLLDHGYKIRVFSRSKDKAQRLFGSKVELFVGDIRDPIAVNQAMQDVQYVFSAIGARTQDDSDPNSGKYVDYKGTQRLIDAAKREDVKQFIMVSTAGLSQSVYADRTKQRPVIKWKKKAETVLQKSRIPYTIVRPGRLMDDAKGSLGGILATQDTYERAKISRDDVASVCVAALKRPAALNKTFEIVSKRNIKPTEDWDLFYSSLRQD